MSVFDDFMADYGARSGTADVDVENFLSYLPATVGVETISVVAGPRDAVDAVITIQKDAKLKRVGPFLKLYILGSIPMEFKLRPVRVVAAFSAPDYVIRTAFKGGFLDIYLIDEYEQLPIPDLSKIG